MTPAVAEPVVVAAPRPDAPPARAAARSLDKLRPKHLVKSVLASPLPYALFKARAHRGRPVTVLCYHTLRPDDDPIDAWTAVRESDFVRQMEFLRAHYDIVSLDAALDARAGQGRPQAVVTFDDGEVGLSDSLLPIVSRLGIPVTLYIATGQIASGVPYWFDAIINALQADGDFAIDLSAHGLKTWSVGAARGATRWGAISNILETLKGVAPGVRPALAAAVVAQAPPIAGRPFKALRPLSVAELTEVSRHPQVTIAAHSHCHNLLDQIPAAEVRDSVLRSRRLLEGWTGQAVRHFAYPNGNHTAEVASIVSELGFASAMALEDRLWHRGMDRFALPRISVGRYDDFDRFKLRLAEI